MLRVVLYGADGKERSRAREFLEEILRAVKITPVFKEFTNQREEFFSYVKHNPYLVMLVLQSGPTGAETVRLAKQANPDARLVWFSDHDYALYAYDLHLTFFGLLPVSRQKLEQAINACWFFKEYQL